MTTPVPPLAQAPSPLTALTLVTLMFEPLIDAVDEGVPLQFSIAPAHASLGNTPTVKIPATARNPSTPCASRIVGTRHTLWPGEFTLPCSQTLLEALPRAFVSSDAATHTPSASFHMLR